MAADAVEAASRLLAKSLEVFKRSLEVVAETGNIPAAIVELLDGAREVYGEAKRLGVAKIAVAAVSVASIIAGAILVLEDFSDFLEKFDHFHHWMLGLILILAGIAGMVIAATRL